MTRSRIEQHQVTDPKIVEAVRAFLLDLAKKTDAPRKCYNPLGVGSTAPEFLSLAVLAAHVTSVANELTHTHVDAARAHDDVTWEEIGTAFGVSRQSAQQRFGSTS